MKTSLQQTGMIDSTMCPESMTEQVFERFRNIQNIENRKNSSALIQIRKRVNDTQDLAWATCSNDTAIH